MTTKLTIDVNQEEDMFDTPPSPPPMHAIYLPSNYHSKSIHSPASEKDEENKKMSVLNPKYIVRNRKYYFMFIKRYIFPIVKKSLQIVFKNNNLLLMMNFIRKFWKQQRKEILEILDLVSYIIKHNGYKRFIIYSIEFFRYHFIKQNQRFSSSTKSLLDINSILSYSYRHPVKSMILMSTIIKQFYVFAFKLTLKYSSKAIQSLGGFDSILLAAATILITKWLQHSTTIF